jgi:hypothetical protein
MYQCINKQIIKLIIFVRCLYVRQRFNPPSPPVGGFGGREDWLNPPPPPVGGYGGQIPRSSASENVSRVILWGLIPFIIKLVFDFKILYLHGFQIFKLVHFQIGTLAHYPLSLHE